jgi:hypothetical protein
MRALPLLLLALLALALAGCATASRAPSVDAATLARRQAAWAGAHRVYDAYLEYGGKNEVSMDLILSPTTPPVFRSWSEAESRVTPSSSARRVAAIPGEVAEYRSSDLSGGAESPQRQSRNKLVKASFDPDYTVLTLLYRDSAFDGLLKRTFRLDESTEPPRVVGDEGSVYTKLP